MIYQREALELDSKHRTKVGFRNPVKTAFDTELSHSAFKALFNYTTCHPLFTAELVYSLQHKYTSTQRDYFREIRGTCRLLPILCPFVTLRQQILSRHLDLFSHLLRTIQVYHQMLKYRKIKASL